MAQSSINYLSVENITKTFGARALFENLSFGISSYAISYASTGWAKNSYSGIYTDYWSAKAFTSAYKLLLPYAKP